MKHSEQLWDPPSYLFNGYWSSFLHSKTVDHYSNHSPSFLHLWMCGATPLLIPYLCDMVSNLWNLTSGVSIMQCHTQTPNIRLRWLHLMAFLKQISFKLWSSLAFTGHLLQDIPTTTVVCLYTGVMAITSSTRFAIVLFNFSLHMIITTAKYILKDFPCQTINCKNLVF